MCLQFLFKKKSGWLASTLETCRQWGRSHSKHIPSMSGHAWWVMMVIHVVYLVSNQQRKRFADLRPVGWQRPRMRWLCVVHHSLVFVNDSLLLLLRRAGRGRLKQIVERRAITGRWVGCTLVLGSSSGGTVQFGRTVFAWEMAATRTGQTVDGSGSGNGI